MSNRPRHAAPRRLASSSTIRRLIQDGDLAVPGSSAEDVAHALRNHRPELRRKRLKPLTEAVRRVLSSDFDDDDDDDSASRGHQGAHATLSSTTSLSDESAHPPPPPYFDATKTMLRSQYASQTSKQNPGTNQQLEIEMTAEKARRLITSDCGGGGGDAKPEAPVSEGVVNGDKWPRFADLGGMDQVLDQLVVEVVVPLCHPELPDYLGVRPVAGLLLYGPPGCGKTTLAHAIANETGVPFYKISAPDIVSGVSGGSEENIRGLFQKAYRTAPSIVFIDEIDAIASKRENLQREMERRIVTQLMTCMDEFHQNIGGDGSDADSSEKKPGYVIVIGATNRPDAVDQALRRPGRFDREIYLGVPDVNSRKQILMMLARKLRLEGQFDFLKIARATPGFVGADLKALVNNAGYLAMKRIINKRRAQYCSEVKVKWWKQLSWDAGEMESVHVTMNDFEEATKLVQPSLRREGFSSIPDVTWDDVGGLDSLRKEFHRYIRCIKSPEDCDLFGVRMQDGFLLFGPPGCGKTLIAKAVAHEAGANFIHIKGPDILNKYVGESESEIRKIFNRARINAPCIVFFDEVDSLTTKRGKEGGWVVERLLNQLLIELDGAGQRKGVYVIGATNRIDMIDDAMLRPGRFGKKHYVPIPGARERVSILKALARRIPVSSTVDLDVLALREECSNFTGADLASLVDEAAMLAMAERWMYLDSRTSTSPSSLIEPSHFEEALSKVKPSISKKQKRLYEKMRKKHLSTT
ncbi:cell division control protein 48 homolog C [Zea mays]|uniref:Cell division control protein 48 homolog C n=1 Tax=Zea mays TaxID=4577 RepID=A0A1D6IJ42_MAIZE|nr:cell division control protein 48 homolog C [Zea mays]ONM59483.1 Cell division control protein 48 homolog C [Zea mays]|eukprot:XP_020396501.1 cell division control protein 48 homolog C [Zea mays]